MLRCVQRELGLAVLPSTYIWYPGAHSAGGRNLSIASEQFQDQPKIPLEQLWVIRQCKNTTMFPMVPYGQGDDAAAATRPSSNTAQCPATSRLQTGLFYKKVGRKTYVSITYLCHLEVNIGLYCHILLLLVWLGWCKMVPKKFGGGCPSFSPLQHRFQSLV